MFRIAAIRMQVRHLNHAKQRQQDETQQGGCPESAWPWALFPA
jgi:hypothetical protein